MSTVDLIVSSLDSITQIAEHVKDAIVYVDGGCAESFELIGAFPVLLKHGAISVCSLEHVSSIHAVLGGEINPQVATKIVVFTCRLLSDAHRYILRCLNTHPAVSCCAIFTSVSEISHSAYPGSPLGPDAYREYESLLLQDYEELVRKSELESRHTQQTNHPKGLTFNDGGSNFETGSKRDRVGENDIIMDEEEKQKLVITVHHFPMIVSPVSPKVFLLPSSSSVAEAILSAAAEHDDTLSPGLPPISSGASHDSEDFPPGAIITAHFLYHLVAKMDLKLEIFSLGDLSKSVGKIMTDMSSLYDVGRRKRAAGLLLIDRTLDLTTPCCHGDSLVDRMFSHLPRSERTTSSSHVKGSQTQHKLGPPSLQRPTLDVQIPLARVLKKEDPEVYDSRLLGNVAAFMHGWDACSSVSETTEIVNTCSSDNDEMLMLTHSKILNGSFVSTEAFRGTPFLEALLDRRTKDGMVLVKKWLQEALRKENLSVNIKSRPSSVTKSDLTPLVSALSKSQSSLIRNKGLIQLAAATLVALDESHYAAWDAFTSAEKILSISAGDTSQSLAAQIGDIINKSVLMRSSGLTNERSDSQKGLLSFQDALLLTVVGYLLAGENFPTSSGGPFSWQEEHMLKEAIIDVILENPSIANLKFLEGLREELEANLSRKLAKETSEQSSDQLDIDQFDDDDWGKWGDESDDVDDNKSKEQSYDDMQLKLELRDRVDNLFKLFHKLSNLKWRNRPLRDGPFSSESNFSEGDVSKGLLYKVLSMVLEKHDIPGLEYHSSTVGRIFKSGFGRFGLGQANPSLADQSVIIVFVVGGINGVEVREAQEALLESRRPDIELILGGTTFLTPNDMLDLLIGNSSYF